MSTYSTRSGRTGSSNGFSDRTTAMMSHGSGPGGGGQGAGGSGGGRAPVGPSGPMRGGPGAGGPMGLGAPVAKPKSFNASIRRLAGELRPERAKIAAVFAMAVVSVALSVVGPKILGNATTIIFTGVVGKQLPAGVPISTVIEMLRARGQGNLADMLQSMNVTPGQGIDFTGLGQTLAIVAGLYLVSAVFQWGQNFVMAGVTQRIVYRLRERVDQKLSRLPLSYFDNNPRGDILSRVTNDIDNISQSLQQSMTQLITSLLTIVGVLIMMLTISWELSIIALLAVPASLFVAVMIAKRSQVQFAAQWKHTGDLNGHVEEMHTGHSIVKVFGRQKEAIELFDDRNGKLYEASRKAQFISGIIMPAMNWISNLNYVAVAVIGGLRVASGQMSLGDVQAFIQYSRQFTFPIVQTASIMNVLQSAAASAERVFELLDAEEQVPETTTPVVLHDAQGRVVFDDVSFSYSPDQPLIEHLDLTVEPGQTVAIVGPTGAGKTTLVNLLMRFYELNSGRILIDGIDTREMTRDNLRSTFGMVLQDAWLFNGTIRENIRYGRLDATEEQVMAAADAAHVDHFVRTLAEGYETVINDDASNVSQGEKQLLTIARAFLKDPEILILDEATSSVDTRTEVLIQKAMARLMKNRTSFVIAHRLSTIRDADVILVINHGKIIEKGTHEELLAAGGFYFDLYNSQFSGALEEAV
jgi:ATP-binding cassette, subfamily B, multidrug efflux pump